MLQSDLLIAWDLKTSLNGSHHVAYELQGLYVYYIKYSKINLKFAVWVSRLATASYLCALFYQLGEICFGYKFQI